MNNIDRLKEIAISGKVAAEDKTWLGEMCAYYGIDKPTNLKCKNCWVDKAVELYARLVQPTTRLKGSICVNGVRYNAETVTDEEVAYLKSLGLKSRFFNEN